MSLKLNDSGTAITIDLFDVFAQWPGDRLADLIDAIACADAVIEQVANQIIDGHTEMVSHGADDSREPSPRHALGVARRRVALAANDLAAAQIESLARQLTEAKATIGRMSQAAQDFRDRYPIAWESIHAAEFPRRAE